MAERKDAPRPIPPQNYPADKARGGEIILRTRLQRAIFIAGLAGAILLAMGLEVAGWLSR
jgi:hypothetical protein